MKSYKDICDAFHEHMSSDPIGLVSNEDFSRADELPDITREDVERDINESLSLAEKIAAAPKYNRNIDKTLDIELAQDLLNGNALFEGALIDGTPSHAMKPNALQKVLCHTTEYIERDPRNKSDIVGGFINRFNDFPFYLASELSRLDRPNAVWTGLEIESGEDFSSVCNAAHEFAQSIGYDKMSHLENAIKTADYAVRAYLERLKTMPKRSAMSIGESATKKLFGYVGIPYELDYMHNLGMKKLRDTEEQVEKLRRDIIQKRSLEDMDTLSLSKLLAKEFACESGKVVDILLEQMETSRDFAYAKGVVKPLTNEEAKIISTPGYLKPMVPIAAVFTPGSMCKGVRRSTLYITEFEGIEEEMNSLITPGYLSHELIPGHHYQLARAQENPSMIRAWADPMELAEGWTTYVAEDIMTELGFGYDPENDMESQLINILENARIGARMCFILACMTGNKEYLMDLDGNMPDNPDILEGSIEFYMKTTGFPEVRARTDIEGFSAEGTYGAMYLLGNHMMHRIVGMAERKQGDKFDRPALLEAILQEGRMPLSYIERALGHKGYL
ncbi:MAG: DUF885 family protein [Candidatus Woesearchaeota archaeon]